MRIFLVCLFLIACGQKEDVEYKKVPYKGDKGDNFGQDAWDLVKANCTSCHATQAPVIVSKDDMNKHKDKICAVLKNQIMPPSGPLEAAKSDVIKKELGCS